MHVNEGSQQAGTLWRQTVFAEIVRIFTDMHRNSNTQRSCQAPGRLVGVTKLFTRANIAPFVLFFGFNDMVDEA